MIEKHFENSLRVKAEGSRKCTMPLTATHLTLEYDGESEGLYDDEMMVIHEGAERHRLIAEAGGYPKARNDPELDRIDAQPEQRQKRDWVHACGHNRSVRMFSSSHMSVSIAVGWESRRWKCFFITLGARLLWFWTIPAVSFSVLGIATM